MPYLYALAPGSGPQSIPAGFDDRYDWDGIDDAEKARRDWVLDTPPVIDPNFEIVSRAFTQGEDGAWSVAYAVLPGHLALARKAARDRVAARRYDAEVGGMVFAGMPLPTDRDTQSKVTGAYLMASADPTFEVANWKVGPGQFITLDNATIIALGNALTAHVQACFNREAAVSTVLETSETTEIVRAVLETEIDKGWPGQTAA